MAAKLWKYQIKLKGVKYVIVEEGNDLEWVVVTGVSRGIGQAIVSELLHRDVPTIGLSRQKQSSIKSPLYRHVCFDWKDLSVINNETSRLSKVKALINNAGVLINAELKDLTKSDMLYMYEVNAIYPLLLVQHLSNSGLFSKRAHVVNIGSVGGVQGSKKFKGLGGYASSKAAMMALSECMQEEWGDDLVVNALALGAVDTSMLAEANFDSFLSVSVQKMASWIVDFTLNSSDLIAGQIIEVKKNDPFR